MPRDCICMASPMQFSVTTRIPTRREIQVPTHTYGLGTSVEETHVETDQVEHELEQAFGGPRCVFHTISLEPYASVG